MKKILLSLVCVTLGPVCWANLDLGAKSNGTPYDRYMTPVREVFERTGEGSKPSINDVRKMMFLGRSFRYVSGAPYAPATPETTATRKAGDCKDKALWLAAALKDGSVRFVIGKAKSSSTISHAWLYWKDEASKWWVLDCTNHKLPIPAESLGADQYIPLYSFGKEGAFRHAASGSGTAVAAVASGAN